METGAMPPAITTQPVGSNVATGATPTLTVVATGANLHYQWYQGVSGNTSTPVGADSAGYMTAAVTTNVSYWVRVTGMNGTADSTTAYLYVADMAWTAYHAQFYTGTPHTSVTTGESASLKKFADGTASGTSLAYSYSSAWVTSTGAVTKNNPCSGTDAYTFFNGKVDFGTSVKTITSANAYTATVTFTGLTPAKKYTVALYAGFDSTSTSTADSKFTLQNASGYANVSSTGTTANGAITSYVAGDSNVLSTGYVAKWSGISPTGSSNTSFSVLVERNQPGVKGAVCPQAVVLIEEFTPAAVPTISVQPVGSTINSGQTASLSVTAAGTGLTYQWYEGTSGDTTKPVSAALSSSLITPVLTASKNYWVRVANSGGSVDSTSALITVNSTATPFDSWATTAGLIGNDALPSADPDGDAVVNLLEYALGMSPAGNSVAGLPSAVVVSNELQYTFRRERADLTYIVETSDTLTVGSWTTVATNPGTVGQNVTVNIPLAGVKKFVRLRVTE